MSQTFNEFQESFKKIANFYYENKFITEKLFNIVNSNHKVMREKNFPLKRKMQY
jgi:hypothetical protein